MMNQMVKNHSSSQILRLTMMISYSWLTRLPNNNSKSSKQELDFQMLLELLPPRLPLHQQNWTLCTLQIGFLRFPHTTETRQLGYFQIIQYLQHKKDIFGFLMYQKSLILGYFPIIKIAAVQMALIRPIRRRK